MTPRQALFCLYLLTIVGTKAVAQSTNASMASSSTTGETAFQKYFGDFSSKASNRLSGLEINGYYRFMSNYRKMNDAYAHLEGNKTNIFIGDDSQIPQFLLNIKGKTSTHTEFGTDFYLWSPMTGAGEIENVKGLNLGVQLYGNFSTYQGDFTVRTGGINWYMLSPFTFESSKGNNRYSLFDRNPWDPITRSVDGRYADFYATGEINQDQRWGNQAFMGAIVEGSRLPHNLSFSLMYGKTQFDGGFSPVPNSSFGGRLKKTLTGSTDYIALNSFNNASYLDSTTRTTVGFNIHTIEARKHVGPVEVYLEAGAGRRYVGDQTDEWGEALSLKLTSVLAKHLSLQLHAFRISPKVFNNSSVFVNSSIQETVSTTSNQNQPVLRPVSSAVLSIGQLANNRQGIELNGLYDIGPLHNSIGYSTSMELENLSDKVTYSHAFNNLALSRFWRWSFPSNVGPYGNLTKIYRAVIESVQLTDPNGDGSIAQRKYFSTIEWSSRYKTRFLNKELFVFYLGSFNTVQQVQTPLPVFSEQALLRIYDHQLETYYTISPSLIWCNYFSYERVIANYHTVTDVLTRRPKNQHGWSIATGFDVALSKGVVLFVRERWMKYEDTSFRDDHYNGYETTLELKVSF